MKELLVTKDESGKVVGEIVDVPKPTAQDNQVLIKVIVTGTNPKDWKYIGGDPVNAGDDIAGIVDSVGPNVIDFRPGDRVAAFHVMSDPHGSFAGNLQQLRNDTSNRYHQQPREDSLKESPPQINPPQIVGYWQGALQELPS
ncbi:hypothetical protein TWF594_009159 [Orbilia oligospora]|uniref:Alcohol dehydrogenase-like N-terminal domain-containing protein n=1 Tax=Orbilia oligospora TaxID=2813651 RepID=A0A7C8JXL0_ORBOL|nr:hypothetical protein TWF703_000122 [Orbilia oligospora]KAF3150514.1 hypothetical protein TWF594_009159 [Orbilia oligospora]